MNHRQILRQTIDKPSTNPSTNHRQTIDKSRVRLLFPSNDANCEENEADCEANEANPDANEANREANPDANEANPDPILMPMRPIVRLIPIQS